MDNALFDEAVKLTPNERVVFAELLLESLEHEDEQIKQTWLLEVKHRIKAVKEGEATLVDLDVII